MSDAFVWNSLPAAILPPPTPAILERPLVRLFCRIVILLLCRRFQSLHSLLALLLLHWLILCQYDIHLNNGRRDV